MEAKDKSFGFDFEGVYTEIIPQKLITYILPDNRKVVTTFISKEKSTTVTQNFEAETENPIQLQQGGWQAILNNFKQQVEFS